LKADVPPCSTACAGNWWKKGFEAILSRKQRETPEVSRNFDGEKEAKLEDVLAVYTRPRDPERPVVCPNETSKQLFVETRVPMPMKPGRPARFDYEYEPNGTANLFMLFAPLEV